MDRCGWVLWFDWAILACPGGRFLLQLLARRRSCERNLEKMHAGRVQDAGAQFSHWSQDAYYLYNYIYIAYFNFLCDKYLWLYMEFQEMGPFCGFGGSYNQNLHEQPCVPIRSSDNPEESHEESHKSLCVARKSKYYPIVFPSVTISNPNAWQNWGERGNNTSNCVWHTTSPKCQDPKNNTKIFSAVF